MSEITVVPRVAVHGVLLEPLAGGIRVKVRGGAAIHLPWDSAGAIAREIEALAASARRVRR